MMFPTNLAYIANVVARSRLRRLRGSVAPSAEFLQLPVTTNTVFATPSNIESIARTVVGGTLVRCRATAGSYNDITLDVRNGSANAPVVFVPEFEADNLVFNGITRVRGSHGFIFGARFQQPGSTEDRLFKIEGADWTVAYCRFSPNGIGWAAEVNSAIRSLTHRCRFDPPVGSDAGGSTGKAQIKYGGQNGSLTLDMGGIWEWCKFDGPTVQREQISKKARGGILRDCTINNNDTSSRDTAVRHGQGCIIERVRVNGGGDIFINGPDHIIRNVVCRAVVIAKGTDDGDAITESTSQFYLAGKRCIVQRVTGDLTISGVPFSGSQFDTDARDTLFSDISGTVTDNGINSGTAPSIAAEAAPNLQNSDVGIDAYRTYVTGAP